MAKQYISSLVDPFDSTIAQPKILDGSVSRSSGLRFRNVGNFTLADTGAATYVVLAPGFAASLFWKRPADSAYISPSVFASHVSTTADRVNSKQIRLVSCGLNLSLLNSSDQNEGYWESVRIPVSLSDFQLEDSTAPVGENYKFLPIPSFALEDMANHSTFQTGKLKDLHRYQFKLNSTSSVHPFKAVNEVPSLQDTIDPTFDVIVIKLSGRVDATTPSLIMYNCVTNEEVIYKENTAMARLHTPSPMMKDMDVILDRTKYLMPAIQFA